MPSTTSLRFPSPQAHTNPPLSPCPWLWRCHACHIWYRLATTRRCLECDHDFCLSDNATTTARSSSSSKKRKRSGGPCRAEFDYIGWAARGAWRRTLLLNAPRNNEHKNSKVIDRRPGAVSRRPLPTSTSTTRRTNSTDYDDNEGGVLLPHRRWLPKSSLTTAWGDEHRALEHGIEQLTDRFAEKKEALYVRRQHNCWLHCDFPSECHHAVYKAQQEGKPVLAKARALDRAYFAKMKAEEERQQKQQVRSGKERGPSGWLRNNNNKTGLVEVAASGGLRLRNGLVMQFSEQSSSSSSSESDSSDDLEFDGDAGADDDDVVISLPGSPPTEDEVVPGQEKTVTVSPTSVGEDGRTSLDMERDYSYNAFKKAAGIEASLTYVSFSSSPPRPPASLPTTTTQTFQIHADENNDDISDSSSPPTSPVTTATTTSSIPITITTTTTPNHLPTFHPFEPFWTTTTTTNAPPRTRSTAPPSPVDPASTPSAALQQLEQAYSAQAWFPSSSSITSKEPEHSSTTQPNAPNRRRRAATTTNTTSSSSSRAESTARMLTLLGRRTSLPSSSSPLPTTHKQQRQQQQQPRAMKANTISIFEEWDGDNNGDDANTTATASLAEDRDKDVDGNGDRLMF